MTVQKNLNDEKVGFEKIEVKVSTHVQYNILSLCVSTEIVLRQQQFGEGTKAVQRCS